MNDEQPAVDPKQELDRPARRQVPGPLTDSRRGGDAGGGGGDINIWSGRRMGPRGDRPARGERKREASKYRCCPHTDTGGTKGSRGEINTFCMHFAKGTCYQGPECTYLHRLPTCADNAAMQRNTGQDIFGREKLPDGLDNRRGAGSYERDMTTLYVHYGGAGNYAIPQLRHLLLENFGTFGPVKGIHIVPTKTIAFVRFHWRASAEFAREAMDQQPLIGSTLHEVLSVKWANEDPNPVAVVGRKRSALDAVETAAMAAWDAMAPEEKQARIAMAQQARARQVTAVAAAMPAAGGGRPEDLSFAAYRGFGGPADEDEQQQQQAQQDGAAAAADPQEVAAQWQAYYEQCARYQEQQAEQAQEQQQQQQGVNGGGRGAWYEGWRQRHQPAAAAAAAGEADGAVGGQAARAAAAGPEAPGVLGLLAGYGSDSDAD